MNVPPDDSSVSLRRRVWEWLGVGFLVVVVVPVIMTMLIGVTALVGSFLSFGVLLFFAVWDVRLLKRAQGFPEHREVAG